MKRPRLGDHVRVRRHLVGDDVRIVLHDSDQDRRMVVGEREWRVLSAMDGSRDVEGIALASGVPLTQVGEFLEALAPLGITGEPRPVSGASPPRDLPVRALPGFGFTCDGGGACCAIWDSVLFTPLESACARAAAPEVLDGGEDPDLAFLPERGLDRTLLAVTMRDGACAYLGDDRRCRIYDARPHGCRTFPMRHVDVGPEIRVAPRIMCACELEPGDKPITAARSGSELPAALWVETLPASVKVGDAQLETGAALEWSDGLRLPDASVADWCAALADELGAAPIDWEARRSTVRALRQEHRWQAPAHPLRRGLEWLETALEPGLESAPEREVPAPVAEALYLRASVFVGALLTGGDAALALRSLEARVRLARRMPAEASEHSFARHPLALINAIARATGRW